MSDDDDVVFTLKYHQADDDDDDDKTSSKYDIPTAYFRSFFSLPISAVKKMIRKKLGLNKTYAIEIAVGDETLPDFYTLIDVAYIYPRSSVCIGILCF